MTLAQWRARYQAAIVPHAGAVIVHETATLRAQDCAMWDLHHLTDYRVTAHNSGPTVWLMPRA
jgi:hypothetical protein